MHLIIYTNNFTHTYIWEESFRLYVGEVKDLKCFSKRDEVPRSWGALRIVRNHGGGGSAARALGVASFWLRAP
jgi:hypothetical protein